MFAGYPVEKITNRTQKAKNVPKAAGKPQKRPMGRPPEPVTIYSLHDPVSGEVRYIGKTKSPKHRLEQHVRDVNRQNMTPCKAWIKSLLASGLRPEMRVIETCREDEWEERERHHIAEHRAQGHDIRNIADGGNQPKPSRASLKQSAKRINESADKPIHTLLRLLACSKKERLDKGNIEGAAKLEQAITRIKASKGFVRDILREYASAKLSLSGRAAI